jgi:threonine dehydrogenase-like Zn-dependent dehydrogenase
MRALVIAGPGAAQVQEVDAPVPRAGQVVVDVRRAGICGTDGQVAVPVSSLHRLPSRLDDRAAALVEPGGNAWRAASAAGAAPGRRVLVCGPGTIGLLTTAFAAAAGAEVHILAVDEGRRSLASSFGATGYWTADDPPPVTYDAVVDCTDDHRVPALALALVEPAGRVVFIGVSGAPSLIDSRDLVLGDLTAVGILGASAGLAPAIEHYADGRVDPSGLVDVTVGLSRAAEALAGQISAGSGTKIHIDPAALGAITWRSLISDAPSGGRLDQRVRHRGTHPARAGGGL